MLHFEAKTSQAMQHSDENNTEKSDEKRSALFTVKDIESALIHFTAITGLYPLVVITFKSP